MSEDEKGKQFLELIDEQNTLHWSMVEKLTLLIREEWNSVEIKNEIEGLIEKHTIITKELNSLDVDNSIL